MDRYAIGHYGKMMRALTAVLSASAAIESGVADHAQKHAASVDARRAELEREVKMNDSIARYTGQV